MTGRTDDLFDPHRHGDADVDPSLLDFAVNVRPGPPDFLRDALNDRIGDLSAYPSSPDAAAATSAAAAAHARSADEVLLLAGAAEGFELLAKLGSRHAAVVQPSFTEPGRVLRAAGIRVTDVVLDAPWRLADAVIPDDADLVVVGNPTNPTSVLHSRDEIDALRRPGRVVVVDEAFADMTLGDDGVAEPESVAAERWPDVIVIRSITKTFALAGLRAGYLLADPTLIAHLERGRRHWPLGTLALTALTTALGPTGQAYARQQARDVAADRTYLMDRLTELGLQPQPSAASFVLVSVPEGLAVREGLRTCGIGVRSCANFVGLTPDHLRFAVRDRGATDRLTEAMRVVLSEVPGDGQTGADGCAEKSTTDEE